MEPQPKERLSRRLQRTKQKELIKSNTIADLKIGILDLVQDHTNTFHASRAELSDFCIYVSIGLFWTSFPPYIDVSWAVLYQRCKCLTLSV